MVDIYCLLPTIYCCVVGVAQLAEHWTVAPMVGGSSPLTHLFFVKDETLSSCLSSEDE